MVFNVHLVESHLKLWWLLVQPISPDVMDIYLDSHVLILLVATNFYQHVIVETLALIVAFMKTLNFIKK